MRQANHYLFDNAWQVARQRLELLEAAFDPDTVRLLEAVGADGGCAAWR
jgi:hypothetical protein